MIRGTKRLDYCQTKCQNSLQSAKKDRRTVSWWADSAEWNGLTSILDITRTNPKWTCHVWTTNCHQPKKHKWKRLHQNFVFMLCLWIYYQLQLSRSSASCLRLNAVCQGKPGTLSSTISHQETHQLKGQYFVGSWIIYNLLKVSSNCEANDETMFKEYQRTSQCRYQG